jgi:hypothetical protein
MALTAQLPALSWIDLGFSRPDRTANRFIDEIYQDIEDDERTLTTPDHQYDHDPHSSIALFIFSFFVFRFHKVEAKWGGIPVILPTFIAIVALAWFLPRTRWFQNQRAYTPMWIFLIPTSGLLISMIVGIGKSENLSLMRTLSAQSFEYNFPVPGFFLQEAGEVGSWVFQWDIPNCDGEECAVFLVIALIVLTLILIVGSAMIPHFWLFSGSILLCLMSLIAIHDLLVRRTTPNRSYYPG